MWFLLVCLLAKCVVGQISDNFYVNILHYNDFHARFVETNPWGSVCNPEAAPCIGGFARLTTVVRQRLAEEPHSLLLNAGDSFQGTIWYNLLRWNVTQEFMNLLPHDAHVLGNHEFDHGIDNIVPYLQHLNASVVTANINDDLEPSIQGLYKPSIVVEKNGRKIGIIGVIISTTSTLAATGNLKFTNEVEAVRNAAEKLNAEGVDVIVVLSHCGLGIDRDIALNGGPYIDIIVGGHSHTLLFNGDVPEFTAFEAEGPYPVVVEQSNRKVLIVQAGAHTQYLGEIKLEFDAFGNLLSWAGNPHYLGNNIEQAPDILTRIEGYLPHIEKIENEEIGRALVHLSSSCRCEECNLGNFICDSYMHAAMDLAESGTWNYAHFCIIQRGGVRADIASGVVTYGSVVAATPFENAIEVFELRGDHIMEMLEYAAANGSSPGVNMLQFSGLRATIDGSKPLNSRVLNVTVRCIECYVPRYEPLELDKYYRIVTHSFLGEGGDGFTMISEHRRDVRVIGVDYAILMDYIAHHSPVYSEVDGRVDISNACMD